MKLTDGSLKTHGTRRQFLKTGSAALAATAVSWNAKSYAAIAGANDRVRVGVVGCGLMGSGIAQVSAMAGYQTIVREVAPSRDVIVAAFRGLESICI